ncbi:MAG: TetR/AcrR family transcriptional regulator [Proteobacteria bacterium]|nr:TetR/AcrR family transcriptional regulator [Pseudomonadota bacterium]
MSRETERPRAARGRYHHGNLVEALIAAAVELIELEGVERLSVREVAKRAGVSPGAPFRHFSSKTALLTAVAEQAVDRLVGSIDEAMASARDAEPLQQLSAMGRGYFAWVRANPTHFQIVSSRSLIDFGGSAHLVEANAGLRARMAALLREARARGHLRTDNIDDMVLSSRAFVYGLARMFVDGHFPEWETRREAAEAMERSLDLFISGLRRGE